MTAEEAALIMMSGGGSPATSLLSLEGIKALKTLATMTIGDFVFEFKEPKIFYAGSIGITSNGDGMNSAWLASEVINNSVAVVSSGGIATEYFAWGDWTDYDGTHHSTTFTSYSDFKVTKIQPYLEFYKNSLPFTVIDFSCKMSQGFDGIVEYTNSSTSSGSLGGYSSDHIKFTNLSTEGYREFIKSYCAAAAVNTPVIKIL